MLVSVPRPQLPNLLFWMLANTAAGQQIRIGSTAATTDYTIGRNPNNGMLDFTGNQAGFIGYTFSGVMLVLILLLRNTNWP